MSLEHGGKRAKHRETLKEYILGRRFDRILEKYKKNNELGNLKERISL